MFFVVLPFVLLLVGLGIFLGPVLEDYWPTPPMRRGGGPAIVPMHQY
jgi:hypothetical protein